MDYSAIGRDLGLLMAIVGFLWKLSANVKTFTVTQEGVVQRLGTIVTQLDTQQRIHEQFSYAQQTQREDLSRLTVELAALVRSVHESDIRRADEMARPISELTRTLHDYDQRRHEELTGMHQALVEALRKMA